MRLFEKSVFETKVPSFKILLFYEVCELSILNKQKKILSLSPRYCRQDISWLFLSVCENTISWFWYSFRNNYTFLEWQTIICFYAALSILHKSFLKNDLSLFLQKSESWATVLDLALLCVARQHICVRVVLLLHLHLQLLLAGDR
jgi:hypothetical protein